MREERILTDTNFLIDLFRFKIDFELENVFVPESVIEELKFLSSSNKKESKFAKLALNLIENKKLKILPKKKNKADDDLLAYAKLGFTIATNDRKLRKRLKRLGFKTIYLRARKQIAVG